VFLTDPALANGVVAVARDNAEWEHALVYRLDGDDRGPALTPRSLALGGSIAAVDRAGAIYVVARGLKVYPLAGQAAPRWLAGIIGITDATGITRITAISHDRTRLAAGDFTKVIVFDAGGAERWRRPVPEAGPVAWSLDDRTLFVATGGGATISFDARTGAQLAMRCGWGFGIYDEDIVESANVPSACAAPDRTSLRARHAAAASTSSTRD
jgi:outer membrane protein assembly factor BamB